MKNFFYALMFAILALGVILMNGCSRIEIQNPAQDEQNIITPYTLVVKHTGCGTVEPETFQAWLDKDSDTAREITNAFSYSQDTWTASDFNLPMGNHTLWVNANVSTGSMCYEQKHGDERTFFVAPCADFVTAWGEDFEFDPDTLIVEYDTTVVKIAQGETKVINLPENSPLLVNGKLPATVKYGIRNKTAKNLKFNVFVKHGDGYLYFKDLAFCGEGLVNEEYQVEFSASSNALNITVEAGDIFVSPSDDVRPVFFSGKLQVRIYPL